jgi:periplasmic copper chaperone A
MIAALADACMAHTLAIERKSPPMSYKSVARAGLASMLSVLAFASPSGAHDYSVGPIKIVHPWTRMPPTGAKVAGGYMTLTNTGTDVDTLLGGTIINAQRLEVHEMSVTDGVMRMKQLQPGLELKPGETVVLKPGSYHVMFMDLSARPETDKRLKGTLVFARAGTVEVEYKVEPAGASTSGAGEHTGHGSAPSGSGSGSGSNTQSGARHGRQ